MRNGTITRTDLAGLLACPVCRGPLAIPVDACACCGADFPASDGIPRLVAPGLALADDLRYLEPPRRDDRQFLVQRLLADATAAEIASWRGDVLDVGCGRKPYAGLARGVHRWVGIDVARGPSTDVVATAERLPFADDSFDHVFLSQVIEHVPRPDDVLCEALRVLRAGGTVVVSAPQTWPLHEAPRDFYRFTRYGLEHMLCEAGFTDVRVRPLGGGLVALVQLALLGIPVQLRIPARIQRSLARSVLWLDARAAGSAGGSLCHLAVGAKP